jgi:predicted TIM-barrel fold metal-dependent hydrolase
MIRVQWLLAGVVLAALTLHVGAEQRGAGGEASSAPEITLREFEPVSMLKVTQTEVLRAKFPATDFHAHISGSDPEQLLKVMAATNLETIVNFSGGSGEALEANVAKFAPYGDRFVTFANVQWNRIDEPDFGRMAAAQLAADVAAGARGLKIFKSLGLSVRDQSGRLVAIDDPRAEPIWAKAGELGIPVAIHVADPDAFFVPVDRFNERWEELQRRPNWSFAGPEYPSKDTLLEQRSRIIARHPKTTFVGLHVANRPENLAEVSALLDRFPNLHVEIGARLNELGRQPYTSRAFFERYADRILFGVDITPREDVYRVFFRYLETFDEYFDYFPSPTPPQGRWRIYGVGLPEEILEKVYRTNARRLLRLD